MNKIKELDDKYLVLKWDDIDKLPKKQFDKMAEVIDEIGSMRTKEGKTYLNKYLVLNLADEIDTLFLSYQIAAKSYKIWREAGGNIKESFKKHTVKDIALDIVNSILKVKGE
jgi:hypothetical protein